MINKTSQTRVLLGHCHKLVGLLVLGVFLFMAAITVVKMAFEPNVAHAATNNQLNFQARLQTSSGNIVPDGFYNVQFKLYDVSSGGTALWTESHIDTNGGTAGNDFRLRVKNGYLTVSLGSQTAFPSTINWDQDLWITMNIGGTTQTATPTYDGEMNPRLKLTGVPYAFRAGQLAKFNSVTGFNSTLEIAAPTGGNQTFTIADQGAAGSYSLLTNANGLQLQATTPGAQQTGSFNISGTGIAGVFNATTGFSVNGTAGTAVTCTGGQLLQNATTVGGIFTGGSCVAPTTGGVTTVGTFSATSIANGASISGNTITFGPADTTNPGMVSTGTQDFAGAKTFNSTISISGTTTVGALTVGQVANRQITLQSGSGSHAIEIGRTDGGASTPYLDFHSGATSVDYDARIIASGGTGAIGGGALALTAATTNVTGVLQTGSTTRLDASGNLSNIGSITSAGAVLINNSANNATSINTGTSNTLVSIGGGSGTFSLQTSNIDISSTGAITNATGYSGTGGITTTGTTSINNNTNSTTNINTGTSTGLVSIGGGSGTFALNTTNIDISSAGAITGATGITSTNTIQGATINATTGFSINGTAGSAATCSGGQLLQNAVIAGGIITAGSCVAPTTGGVTTVGTFSVGSIVNGASISGNTITLGGADATNPGMVTTGAQIFAGNKTFNGTVGVGALTIGPTSNQQIVYTSGAANHNMEIGRTDGVASFPLLDFHSGATAVDYDARIVASGGNGTDGGGSLSFNAANTNVSGNLQTGGTTRIDAAGNLGNIGAITSVGNINTTGSLILTGIVTTSAVNVFGYATNNTGASDAGKWTKLATCTLTVQYSECRSTALVVMTGDGSGTTVRADVNWRVKQQAAFGADPAVGLEISDVDTLMGSNFKSVIISNAGPTVTELWGQVPGSYQTWSISPSINAGGVKTVWHSTQGFSPSLPAGTQTSAVYADERLNTLTSTSTIRSDTGFNVNGTAGASTTCTGGQLLQNAVVLGGIVTGGTCVSPVSGGVTTVGTFSATSIANGASISGNTITLGVADAVNPGMISTTTQTIAGAKTFTGNASLFKPGTNSVTAFQIQPSGSTTPVLNVDTTNGRVGIGTAAPGAALSIATSGTNSGTNGLRIYSPDLSKSIAIGYDGSNVVMGGYGQNFVFGSSIYMYGAGLEIENINTSASTASSIYMSNASGTQTNGMLIERSSAGGTTTNGLNVTNTAGTLVNGIQLTGTMTNLINATNFSVTGAGALTAASTIRSNSGFNVNGTAGATTTCSGGQFLQNAVVTGGIVTGGSCAAGGAGGVTTVGTFSATSIANGASISGSTITLGVADGTNPGMLSTTTQTIAGAKTFSGNATISGITALNGNVTIGDATSDRVTLTAQLLGGSPLVLQGATDNSFATTLALVDPTANNTITLPNASGTVAVSATGNVALNASGQISLTGTIGVGNGGTGSTAGAYTTNGVLYYNGSSLVSTAAGTSGDCLKSNGSGSAPTYGACGTGSASTLQDAYTASGSTNPQIQLSAANGGLKIRDSASPVSGNLFQLQNSGGTVTYFGASTAGISIQNASATNALVFTSADGHLKIYNPSNASRFVDIYYDNATSEAVFTAAGGGTTRIGSGSGNITLNLSNAADILTATKTLGSLGGAYNANDFNFTRSITAGATALNGSVVNIESLSSGSANASTILRVNENNNSATGNLIVATKGGAGNDKFKVDTGGTVTIAAGQSYAGAGALTVNSGAGTALTITGNAASTFSTTAGALTLTGAGGVTINGTTGVTISGGSGNITLGTSDTTGTLLVLDTKTSSGDPTGVNGAMYYNSNMNKFRCQKNSVWEDCMTARTAKKTANQTNNTTTLADVTDLSFSVAASTDYLLSCTVSYQTVATTTGIRLTVNGPASPTLISGTNAANISASTTSGTFNINGYNNGGTSLGVATANTNMIATMDVIIRNGANAGTVAVRMASEIASSNVTLNAGSFCTMQQM